MERPALRDGWPGSRGSRPAGVRGCLEFSYPATRVEACLVPGRRRIRLPLERGTGPSTTRRIRMRVTWSPRSQGAILFSPSRSIMTVLCELPSYERGSQQMVCQLRTDLRRHKPLLIRLLCSRLRRRHPGWQHLSDFPAHACTNVSAGRPGRHA